MIDNGGPAPSKGAAPRSSFSGLLLPALIAALTLILFSPVLRWLVHQWLTNDYYSHGPVVVAVSAYLSWVYGRRVESKPSNFGIVIMAAGMLVYLWSFLQRAYYLGAIGLVLFVAGLVTFLLGVGALKKIWFPVAFLLFMIPFPFVERASYPLQRLTGVYATHLARFLGIDATVSGAQVSLPKANLVVGAQCSGLRSIVAMLTLSVLFVYLIEGNWFKKLAILLAAFPAAIAGNILRVASLLFVANIWGADRGFHYYHNYSGIVFFAAALSLLFLLAGALGCNRLRNDIYP